MLISLLIALIIISYITVYTKPKQNIEILQTDKHNLSYDVLLEKQPIVVFDEIKSIHDVIDSFQYTYLFKKAIEIMPDIIYQNDCKYILLHNNSNSDINITIFKKITKTSRFNTSVTILQDEDETGISIIMKPFNVLIIPYLMAFRSSEKMTVHCLNDPLHVICL